MCMCLCSGMGSGGGAEGAERHGKAVEAAWEARARFSGEGCGLALSCVS